VAPVIRFGVQANVASDGRGWTALARRVESLGFDGLYVADHPGVTASPFAALAAAGSVTSTLRLGTYVLNTGMRDPVALASSAATVDALSNGRLVLGLGAGHTPAEWTMSGLPFPRPGARIERLAETIEVVTRLLAGEVVTFDGEHLHLDEAFLLAPRPVQGRVPLLVGGNGTRLLELAGERADIVSLTGLGRTLEDGHHHHADWSPRSISERVELVCGAARDRAVVLDALVQHVEITNERQAAARRLAGFVPGLRPQDVLAAPYALVGTPEELVDELFDHHRRWGIASYVVRAEAIDAVAPLIERLTA
jgi:probable F420-dependent oxidoreductase